MRGRAMQEQMREMDTHAIDRKHDQFESQQIEHRLVEGPPKEGSPIRPDRPEEFSNCAHASDTSVGRSCCPEIGQDSLGCALPEAERDLPPWIHSAIADDILDLGVIYVPLELAARSPAAEDEGMIRRS